MSNDFPTPPSSYNLAGLQYTVSSSYQYNNWNPVSGSDLDFSPDVNTSIGGTGQNAAQQFIVSFGFATPGTVGSFDQTTAEAQVTALANDYCQALADVYGDTLANIQATVTITRNWTWQDSSGEYQVTYTDTLTYPS